MFGIHQNEYDIASERELAEILSVFNSDYIFDVVSSNIARRYECHISPMPNIPNVFKYNFENMYIKFPMDKENTKAREQEIYNEIIDQVCKATNLTFQPAIDGLDAYFAANCIYDLIVARFSDHMVTAITKLIINEANNICDALNVDELKKNKDSSTIYNRMNYKNDKLVVILSNMELVLKYIAGLTITFDQFVNLAYDAPISDVINSNFSDNGTIFKDAIDAILSSNQLLPDYITNIRLNLQGVEL